MLPEQDRFSKVLELSSSFSLHKKCPYLELFCSAFSRTRTEYGEIRSISPYSVRVRENAEQNNVEYEHFSCSLFFVAESVNVSLRLSYFDLFKNMLGYLSPLAFFLVLCYTVRLSTFVT